jgi:hypothetical protein
MINDIKIIKSIIEDKMYIGVVYKTTEDKIFLKNVMHIEEDHSDERSVIIFKPYMPWNMVQNQNASFLLENINILVPSQSFEDYYVKKYQHMYNKRNMKINDIVNDGDNVIVVDFNKRNKLNTSSPPMGNTSPIVA